MDHFSGTKQRIKPGLTDEDGHDEASQPLLLHLLDLGLLTGRRGFAHDSEGVDVGDRAHSGGREPRQAKERTDGAQDDDEEEVQVEPRALHQPTLLFTDNQSGESRMKWKNK